MAEAVAVISAILSDSAVARSISSSFNSSPYHLNEKPDQRVTIWDSLKEKITNVMIGKYRNK